MRMILYPTETVYGLGVNALDLDELSKLYELKGRDNKKSVSWLVRDLDDVRRYAIVGKKAVKIAERFLPGPLTLVLKARDTVPRDITAEDGTIGFRISSDPIASGLIEKFMSQFAAPLTATSANVSGMKEAHTTKEILAQFGEKAAMIDEVINDGERNGTSSTVVRAINDVVEVMREGAIPKTEILRVEDGH